MANLWKKFANRHARNEKRVRRIKCAMKEEDDNEDDQSM